MNRRTFIQTSAAGGLLAGLAPLARAGADPLDSPLAGSLFYTAAHPGRWAKKVGGHVPHIKVADGKVGVVTKHGMHGYKHYIVKHQLLDADFQLLGERLFDPDKDEAESAYVLPVGYKGRLYALSLCNKHDLWVSSAEV